jgi:hypothetical protein
MLAASEDFLVEAARAELARCWPKPNIAAICAAMDAIYAVADGSWQARRGGIGYLLSAPAPACKPGCGWCCHQQVGIALPEAIRLAAHIAALPAAERDDLTARAQSTAARTRGMGPAERAAAKLPCAFLGSDGNCRVYAARPLRCRGLHSIDVDFCIACHDDFAAMRAKLERGELKPVFLDIPERIFDSALAGILKALAKTAPKAVVSLELSAAVAALLAEPRLAAKWLGGARPDSALHSVAGGQASRG